MCGQSLKARVNVGKILVIAEKPSVQTDLARVLGKKLGKFSKKGKDRNSYFENEAAIVTSAVGHLVELKMPSGPNGKKLPWGIKHLPVIPDSFELQPIEKSESRLNMLLRLIKSKEVDQIVNACDAGREGELIFRYIMALAGVEKPMKRMWMQSMTDGAIIEAFSRLHVQLAVVQHRHHAAHDTMVPHQDTEHPLYGSLQVERA